MQADPFVQAPYNLQSLNRYSYAWNNPLNATDPSGFVFKWITKALKSIRRGILRVLSKVFGTDVVSHFINVLSAFCGAGQAACAAYGHYELARANGVPAKYARKAGALAGIRQLLFPTAPMSSTTPQVVIYNLTGQAGADDSGSSSGSLLDLAKNPLDRSIQNNLAKSEEVANGEIQIDTVSTTMTETTGNKFSNGASQRAFMETLNAGKALQNLNAQQDNPAQSVANKALEDNHLTLNEANKVWRANNDPNFEVTVDASKLSVTQLRGFGPNGYAPGKVQGVADWLVHGSVSLSRDAQGNITIPSAPYDFQPHGSFWSSPVRNFETYGGFYLGSGAGTSVGTDFLINYSGSPNVSR